MLADADPGTNPDSERRDSAKSIEDSPTASTRGAMDARLAHAVAWTGGMKWAIQLLSWLVTLITARLLVPADYGYLAVLTVITRFMLLVTEGGVGAAITNGPPIDAAQMQQLHTVSTLTGLGSFAVVVLVGWPVSHLAGDPAIALVLAALGATLVFEGWNVVPTATLKRAMNFRDTALADGARSVTDLFVTLALAFAGARYWSLVGGYSAGILAYSFMIHRRARVAFARPNREELSPVLRFSRQLLGRNISGFVAYSGDTAIGRTAVTTEALGLYSLAFTIAYAPGEKVTQLILRVVPALLGNVREQRAELTRYFLGISSVLALVTFPMFAGIALVAHDVILVLLNERWLPMVACIVPLCVYGAITESLAMVPHVLQSLGETRLLVRNGLFALMLMPLSFLALSHQFGVGGLAAAWAVGAAVLGVGPLRVACARLQIPLSRFLANLAVPLLATTAMIIALVVLNRADVMTSARPVVRLGADIAVGAALYATIIMLFARSRVMALWSMGRGVLGRARA